MINKTEHTHEPIMTHILLIILAPLTINHRRPWQCGVAVINGDKTNPIKENGTQNLIYKCEAKKCNIVHTKYIPYKEIAICITLDIVLPISINITGIVFKIYSI
jgi:hypothetical protein